MLVVDMKITSGFLKKVYTIEHSFKTIYVFPSYNFKKLNHKIDQTHSLYSWRAVTLTPIIIVVIWLITFRPGGKGAKSTDDLHASSAFYKTQVFNFFFLSLHHPNNPLEIFLFYLPLCHSVAKKKLFFGSINIGETFALLHPPNYASVYHICRKNSKLKRHP